MSQPVCIQREKGALCLPSSGAETKVREKLRIEGGENIDAG